MRRGGWPVLLTPFIPIAIVLELAGARRRAIFVASALGDHPDGGADGPGDGGARGALGPGIGGLLNVTFGNAPELIIALFALVKGLQEVVKASIIGSIIGNILLVLGAAMFFGGLGRERRHSTARRPARRPRCCSWPSAALVMPAVFELVEGGGLPAPGRRAVNYGSTVEHLSLAVAVVLIVTYLAGLVFSLQHPPRPLQSRDDEDDDVGRLDVRRR